MYIPSFKKKRKVRKSYTYKPPAEQRYKTVSLQASATHWGISSQQSFKDLGPCSHSALGSPVRGMQCPGSNSQQSLPPPRGPQASSILIPGPSLPDHPQLRSRGLRGKGCEHEPAQQVWGLHVSILYRP